MKLIHRISHVVLAALIASSSMMGCAKTDEYRYVYTQGYFRYPSQSDMQTMIDTCHIEPNELVMADLKSDYLAKRLKNQTCNSIHKRLAQFHTSNIVQPTSLWNNPALTTSPPSVVSLRYAAISAKSSNSTGGDTGPNEVFIDFANHTVLYGPADLAMSSPVTFGMTTSLSVDSQSIFADALTPLLNWGNGWTVQRSDAIEADTRLFDWKIAIIASDDRLYRWSGAEDGTGVPQPKPMYPTGLLEVSRAFWDLIP